MCQHLNEPDAFTKWTAEQILNLSKEVARLRWFLWHRLDDNYNTLLSEYERLNPAWIDANMNGTAGEMPPVWREDEQ